LFYDHSGVILPLQAYADGLLVIPKTLAVNAGYDSQEVIVKLLEEGASGQKVSVRLKIVFIFNIFFCHLVLRIHEIFGIRIRGSIDSTPLTNGSETGTVGIKVFFLLFLLVDRRIRRRILISLSLTNGSGSARPKNIWIQRIRIRNTDIGRIALLYSGALSSYHCCSAKILSDVRL
jgi:hypothetical protein